MKGSIITALCREQIYSTYVIIKMINEGTIGLSEGIGLDLCKITPYL